MSTDNTQDLVAPLPDRPEYHRGDEKDEARIHAIRQVEHELANRKFQVTTQGHVLFLHQKVSRLEQHARSYFHDPPNLGSPLLALDIMLHSAEDTERTPVCRSMMISRLLRASLMLLTPDTYEVRRDILFRVARLFAYDNHAFVRKAAYEYLQFYYGFLKDCVGNGAPSADLADPETHNEIGRIITSSFSDGTMLTEQCSMVNDIIAAAQELDLMLSAVEFEPNPVQDEGLYVVALPTENPIDYRRPDFGRGPDSEAHVALRDHEQTLFESPNPPDFMEAARCIASWGKSVFCQNELSRETALATSICIFALTRYPREDVRFRILTDLLKSGEDIPTEPPSLNVAESNRIKVDLLSAVGTLVVSAFEAREREAALRLLATGVTNLRRLTPDAVKESSLREDLEKLVQKIQLFRQQEGSLSVYEVAAEKLQTELTDWTRHCEQEGQA